MRDLTLENLKTNMESNGRALELFAAYIRHEPELVKPEMIKTICDDCKAAPEQAFAAILSAAFGLDPENDRSDRIFERRYVEKAVKLLDPADYESDPYYVNIAVKGAKRGKWELCTKSYAPYEGFVYDDILCLDDHVELPRIGFFEKRFRFAAVLENGIEWMTITPNEINTMRAPVSQARGKVLTYGLGMGYFAYMAHRKDGVESVTVVERDPDVISLFKEFILPQFDRPEKIGIVRADAFEHAGKILPTSDFDFVFVDLWHDVSDGLDMYFRMKKKERLSPHIEFTYWIERSLISALRRMVYEELISRRGITASEILPMLEDGYLISLAGDIRRQD